MYKRQVSILFFAVVGWNANVFVRLASRLIFLPFVAGISYELLRFAAKHDNLITRIIRAPGMGLQYITTKEPTPDMIEVAITAFELAMDPERFAAQQTATVDTANMDAQGTEPEPSSEAACESSGQVEEEGKASD